jgi:hypothetical protein
VKAVTAGSAAGGASVVPESAAKIEVRRRRPPFM